MDIATELENIISIYFSGKNYTVDGFELSRENSKMLAYHFVHALQMSELIMARRYRN